MNELPSQPEEDLFVPTDITKMNFWNERAYTASVKIPKVGVIAAVTKPKKSTRRSIWIPPSLLIILFITLLFTFYDSKWQNLLTFQSVQNLVQHLLQKKEENLSPLSRGKGGYEVFGFAPHWTFDKLDNVDFQTLTTLAYFGIEAKADGSLDTESKGYETFMSPKATRLFKKAHKNGTRVVLTLTQMDNDEIKTIMDDMALQDSIINQSMEMVKSRGIDGINIDFEYTGDPGEKYRIKFSAFAKNLTDRIHAEIPGSRVTASVYASAVKDPKIYNIRTLAQATDGIFMMAYDFAVAGSKNAIPTAPLYGYKEGKYWYDISTAVDAFLTQMPSDKLILGVPWYGYNYAVESPAIKTATTKGYYTYYKKGWRTYSNFVPLRSHAQTYSLVKKVNAASQEISDYREGFDEYGKVSWKAYSVDGNWRMVFIDDVKSQAFKYDFAKEKNLAGIGMWALGFDDGNREIWDLLKDKFGAKSVADSSVTGREIR